jgi:hypothetical protein
MMKRLNSLFFIILIVSLFQIYCSVPHRVLPQKDMPASELNDPTLDKKVLVASRYSEFKEAVIGKLKAAFKDQTVYIKFIGLGELEKEDANAYNAVVMINKCMAWQMDRNVIGFLKRYENQGNMIVLTTSGDGNWLPKMEERNFDAISSASEKANVDEVAGRIIEKVNSFVQ